MTRLRAALLAVVLSAAPATAAAPAHSTRCRRADSVAADASGRHDPRTLCRRTVAPQPADLDVVRALIAENRLQDALVATEHLPDPVRATAEVRRVHADLLAWTGQLDRAAAEYDALLVATPADQHLQLARALVDKWRGHPLLAERAMAAIEPSDSETVQQLQLLRASPEFQLARARADAEARPNNPVASVALVHALSATDQLWEAEQTLTGALAAHPTDADLLAAQAEFHTRKVTLLSARIAARTATLAVAVDGDEARVTQAEDLAALGRFEAAAAEYERYTRAHPERRDLVVQAARLLTWAGDYGGAERLYADLLHAQPDDASTQLETARVLAWDGDLAGASRVLDTLTARPDVGAAARGLP